MGCGHRLVPTPNLVFNELRRLNISMYISLYAEFYGGSEFEKILIFSLHITNLA
jgi:hypothetical protein